MDKTNIKLIEELNECIEKGEFINPASTFGITGKKEPICPMTDTQKAMNTLSIKKTEDEKIAKQLLEKLIRTKSSNKNELRYEAEVIGFGKEFTLPSAVKTLSLPFETLIENLSDDDKKIALSYACDIFSFRAQAAALKAILKADLFTCLAKDSGKYQPDINKHGMVIA